MRKFGWEKIFALGVAASLALTALGGRWMDRQAAKPVFYPVRLAGRQLILDAGHGGEDGGAVSVTGVPESQINLAVTLKLDQLLGFYGLPAILLRESDISLHDPSAGTLREKKVSDLHNRVSAIESVPNALVVSIHQNTFPDPAYHGSQVFFRDGEESQAVAQAISEALQTLDPENHRKCAKIPDSVYLMKHITCPAALVECGFLSNAAEEEKLRNGGYQTQLALCIAAGVLKWENRGGEIQGPVV